ncbi:MAG: ABC transporter ATP-binding protein [Anaeroplasmataceae bacterium]|nr:ABC transporter ATP-binding protein [Anaeroplasmataceae bacterium]
MIKLKDINKKYGEQNILNQFSLELPSNSITCILGKSGAGKTTILNMIAGLTDYQGDILTEGKIAYIFQEPRLISSLTVIENLKFVVPNVTEEDIDSILKQLDILDKKLSYPNKLSGGEAQRVSIARAFLFDAPIILMDEPFSSLDIALKYKLIQYFSNLWNQKKQTVLFVTHNVDEALLLAQEILILNDGKIVKSYQVEGDLPRGINDHKELRENILNDLLSID